MNRTELDISDYLDVKWDRVIILASPYKYNQISELNVLVNCDRSKSRL